MADPKGPKVPSRVGSMPNTSPKVIPLIAYQLADQLLQLETGLLPPEADQARVLRLAGVTDMPTWTRDSRDRSWTVTFPRDPGAGKMHCVGSGRTRPAAWLQALRTLQWLVAKEHGVGRTG